MKIKYLGNPNKYKIGNAPDFLKWFEAWAFKKYQTEVPVKETWFVSEPAVSNPDGSTIGFAAYAPDHQIILAGTGSPLARKEILHNIAHRRRRRRGRRRLLQLQKQ